MDMMEIRRRVLLGSRKKKLPDTTVKIAEYGYKWDKGREVKKADSNYGITIKYDFPAQSDIRTLVQRGHESALIFYTDGVYKDWWMANNGIAQEAKRKIVNAGANQVSMSVYLPMIDDAYLYIEETGEILYAGKNSPYYGYTNINDMP